MTIEELCDYYTNHDPLNSNTAEVIADDARTLAKELKRRLDEDKAIEIDIQRIIANLPPLKPGKGSVAIDKLRELTNTPEGSIVSVLERAAVLLTAPRDPVNQKELAQIRRGAHVATAVWEWLLAEERMEYVPWGIKNDPSVAGKQAERKELLSELKRVIKEASNVS